MTASCEMPPLFGESAAVRLCSLDLDSNGPARPRRALQRECPDGHAAFGLCHLDAARGVRLQEIGGWRQVVRFRRIRRRTQMFRWVISPPREPPSAIANNRS